MLRHSLIVAAFALATIASSAVPGSAATANVSGHPHYRTVVHHIYTYEPAPSPYYYGRYYGPSYAPAYAPAALIAVLPGAAVCLAFFFDRSLLTIPQPCCVGASSGTGLFRPPQSPRPRVSS
jgi:hypothetical protein